MHWRKAGLLRARNSKARRLLEVSRIVQTVATDEECSIEHAAVRAAARIAYRRECYAEAKQARQEGEWRPKHLRLDAGPEQLADLHQACESVSTLANMFRAVRGK